MQPSFFELGCIWGISSHTDLCLLPAKDAAMAKWCQQAEQSSMHEEVEIIE